MAPTITRDMVTQYKQSDGGVIPDGMYIVEVPKMTEFVRRFDNPMLKLVKPGETHVHEIWPYGEGDLLPDTTTVVGAHTNNTTSLAVADNKVIQKWSKIRIPTSNEQMLVTDPRTPGDNIVTVRRNWPAGGNGVALLGGELIQIMSPNIPEGADAVDSPIALGELRETYPEIIEYTWKYTHRGRVTPNYEVKTDQFKYQMKKKMKEGGTRLDTDLLNSKKNKGDASGTNPSSMGGLREATDVYNQDMLGAPLDWLSIMTLAQTVWQEIGTDAMPKTFMGGFFAKRVWNSWFQKSRRTGGMDKTISLVWDSVQTDFGTVRFVFNHKCDANELFLWNPDESSLDQYEGGDWTTGLYSTQGWYDRGFLRYDGGPIYEVPRHRMRWFAWSTDPNDYNDLDVPA